MQYFSKEFYSMLLAAMLPLAVDAMVPLGNWHKKTLPLATMQQNHSVPINDRKPISGTPAANWSVTNDTIPETIKTHIRTGSPKAVVPKIQVKEAAPLNDSTKARITLDVQNDWGDGSGYQMLLDKDATAYGTYFSDLLGVSSFAYDQCEYKLPENASYDGNMAFFGDRLSVDIPAGTYDYIVVNLVPDPNMGSLIYLPGGPDAIRDNFTFTGGCEYVFTVSPKDPSMGNGDYCQMTASGGPDLSVTAITSPVTGKNLTATEPVTVTVSNNGAEPVSSFDVQFSVDGGTPVTESVDRQLEPGATFDYTFNATADLSLSGLHTIVARTKIKGDMFPGNDSTSVTINNNAPIDPPYTCTFGNAADSEQWNILDANDDMITWYLLPTYSAAEIDYSATDPADDYLITANPIRLKPGTSHVLLTYNGIAPRYYESMEVLCGTSSDVDSMNVIGSIEHFTAETQYITTPVNFTVDEAGEYYFAIHATSPADQAGIILDEITIAEGRYAGTPDVSVRGLALPTSSCSLGKVPVSVTVTNNGTGSVKAFTLTCSVNGESRLTQQFSKEIGLKDSVNVNFDDDLDLSAPGKYDVTVSVTDVIPADGDLVETNTGNNSTTSSVKHFEPADIPFVVNFADEATRDDWYSDTSWTFDNIYNDAKYCVGPSPLVSRGVNLKAGTDYSLTYTYKAGYKESEYYTFSETYRVLCGQDGTDPSDWSVLKTYNEVYTDNAFTVNELRFTVPTDGLYQLAFAQDLPMGTLGLKTISLTEVQPYDVKIEAQDVLPAKIPASQMEGVSLTSSVVNRGSATVSGTVTAAIEGGEVVGSAPFEELAPGNTTQVVMPLHVPATVSGPVVLTMTATIDGKEDADTTDNSISMPLEVTSDILGYDYVTDSMYTVDHTIDFNGIQGYSVGVHMHINNATELTKFSVGWGDATTEEIGLLVFKFDPETAPDMFGYLPLGDLLYEGTAQHNGEIGQVEYPLSEKLELKPGDYMLAVSCMKGVAADGNLTGKFYTVSTSMLGGYVALDESIQGFGTPAIRAVLDMPTGIDHVAADSTTPDINIHVASGMLTLNSADAPIETVTICSASGAILLNQTIGATSFSCSTTGYTPGIYIVKATTKTGTKIRKVTIL